MEVGKTRFFPYEDGKPGGLSMPEEVFEKAKSHPKLKELMNEPVGNDIINSLIELIKEKVDELTEYTDQEAIKPFEIEQEINGYLEKLKNEIEKVRKSK